MLFKAYVIGVKAERPIEQVDSINEALWACIENMMDCGKLANTDDEEQADKEIGEAWNALSRYFNKHGIIKAGEYQIVKAEHRSCVKRLTEKEFTTV
jgi:hypothetical protein